MIEEANAQQLRATIESGNLPEGMTDEQAEALLADYNEIATKTANSLDMLGGQSSDAKEW